MIANRTFDVGLAWWMTEYLRAASRTAVSPRRRSTACQVAYNAALWVCLLPFLTAMDYGIGFIAFAAVIVVRFAGFVSRRGAG